ncbi:MAG: aminotransferase class I/II-fold pyridoxal phosphate-dependent enzyme [Steroidobacteraceae bacterium]|jgi:cystathionine gamma-synthase|nr:aminotransferase class I/II-fold pyridoxal phosphate-dependent enzyme [Steroidobacteraceae bacterium]
MDTLRLETLAIHAARSPDAATGAVAQPIHLSTTFQRNPDGSYPHGWSYARADNPTRRELERAIAPLEGGQDCVSFGSGTAASLAVFATLEPGDHVLVGHDCYHGTLKQLANVVARWGVTHARVDMADLDAVRRALTPRTRLLWVESPSNPMLRLADLGALAEIAHENGARLAADNTFATPVLQRPLALGADYVMHSTTKYFGGHSDVTGGAVIVREAGPALDRVRLFQQEGGGVPAPFDCWLIRRSLATLPLRVRQQSANAHALAEALAAEPNVAQVYYPGLATHPNHALAARQMSAFGAMLSIRVRGGEPAALAVAARTRLFTRATSLGGVESLVEHRASVEGPDTPTPRDLLRLSVGLEHVDDLLADLRQALAVDP